MTGEQPDTVSRLERGARRVSSLVRRYHRRMMQGLAVAGAVFGGLAYFAPGSSDLVGSWILLVLTSNATHTFLLLTILLVLMVPDPETGRHRTDGGESGVQLLGWAFLFGLIMAYLASSIGDRWVLPALILGMALFFYLENV